jgi:hypothetical protein
VLEQDRADETHHGVRIGENVHDIDALFYLVECSFSRCCTGELNVGEHVGLGLDIKAANWGGEKFCKS